MPRTKPCQTKAVRSRSVDAVGLVAVLVEEADLDAGGVLGVDGEVGAEGVGLGAERVRLSGEKGVGHGPQRLLYQPLG